jgi:putative tryptophan/tyrosine transport system substrate-binding protein
MRRREVLALFGTAVTWPRVGYSQHGHPVIGFLSSRSPDEPELAVEAFRQGLREGGYVEGENLIIEFRWAHGHYERVPALANDLVKRQVALIVAAGGDVSALAARAATATIPIVFTGSDDPVRFGLVTSLNRPGGNITGMSLFTSDLEVKRLALLRELVPQASLVAMLVNPHNPSAAKDIKEVRSAADAVGQPLAIINASTEAEIDAAFAEIARIGAKALLVGHDPYFNTQRNQIVSLTGQHEIPAIFEFREFVLAGGLMSYGSRITENYRFAGIYAARILKGAAPADLPVVQPTTFELALNLRTAKEFGIEIPPSLLARADEVIE